MILFAELFRSTGKASLKLFGQKTATFRSSGLVTVQLEVLWKMKPSDKYYVDQNNIVWSQSSLQLGYIFTMYPTDGQTDDFFLG